MKITGPPVDAQVGASSSHHFAKPVHIFVRQARLALGVRGVAWATAAGIVGLACCAVAFFAIAISLQSSDFARSRQEAARITELDRSYRELTQAILAMGTGSVRLQEGQIAVRGAWSRLTDAMTVECTANNGPSSPMEQQTLCASFAQKRQQIGTEVQLLAPPARRMAPATASDLIAIGDDITNANHRLIEFANDDSERMSNDYRLAIFVLTLSTAGFVGAGLILIFLIGRGAVQATDARDLLEETIEALPAGVVLYDTKDRLLIFNSEAASVTPGLKQPGAIGRRYIDVAREAATAREAAGLGSQDTWFADQVARFASKGDRGVRQLPDGRWIELYEKATPAGRTVGLRVDITDHKNRELELEHSRTEYQSLVDSLSDVVFTVDVKGTFTFVSAAAADLFEAPVSQLVGSAIKDYVDPEDWIDVRDAGNSAYKSSSKGVHQLKFRLRLADGRRKHVEIRFRRSSGSNRRGNGALSGVIRDIDERIRTEHARDTAEEQLRQSHKHYRLLFDANPYATTVTDRETLRIVDLNLAAKALYGWSREEVLALTADDFYQPEDVPAMTARRQRYRPDTPEMTSGQRHRKKDGTVIDVEMAACIIDYNGRPANLTIVTDISERLRTERAHRAAEEQLRQSQKMEAVGQLTGGVAHDFNNILTVILANADALQEEENLDPGVVMRLDQIASAVLRASDLTRSLLAFSRKQSLSPKPIALNDLVSATGKLLSRTLGASIELNAILSDDLWVINVDRGQLESALVNLCINARDAMPDGGRLLIETKNVALDKEYIARNPDTTAGEYVLIAVSDTGSGMPPDVLAKVFEPFFTTKGVGKGTGLGLSMVYGFIRQSKGHITVESKIGHGTSFKLYLPRSKDGQMEMAVEQKTHMTGGTERLLVVEDEPQVRASVVLQLESLGYAVSQASDGAAGVAAFEAASPPFDLLLTDVVMPGPLNGKALADEVICRWPTTRIVFMSGYTDNILTPDGTLTADIRFVSKPFRKADLAEVVRRALDGERLTA